MNIPEVQARFQTSRDVQAAVASEWMWDKKTLDQWDLEIAQFIEHIEAESIARQTEVNVRTQRNAAYKTLSQRTIQSLAFLKVAARENPAHTELLGKLPGTPKGNVQILARAQAVSDAWKQTLPRYAPTPDLTQANLEGALIDCRTLESQSSEWKAKWRKAAEALNTFAKERDADAKAWYGLATRLFAAGTTNGDLIRGRIPTTYRRTKPSA